MGTAVLVEAVANISSGGGKTVDDKTGERVQTKAQDDCTLAVSFIRSRQMYQQIGVIAGKFLRSIPIIIYLLMEFKGQGNTGSPSKLPHYYNVLDYFHITDVWCEKYNGVSRWMVRLEKINLNEISWWSPQGKRNVLTDPQTCNS